MRNSSVWTFGVSAVGKNTSVNAPPCNVNQTFDSNVFEVPTACLPALVQRASLPGAPGAKSICDCAESGKLHVSRVRVAKVSVRDKLDERQIGRASCRER